MSSEAQPAIAAQGLSKSYRIYERPAERLLQLIAAGLRRRGREYGREFKALQDVNFEVAAGEVLGVVGRNGAGKSTLLQLICGTLMPTAGRIVTRGRIAALLELGAGFNSEFTGRENIFLAASVMGLEHEEIEARLEGIIDFSGIRDFIDQPVKTYSSGMYVRLAFSVATALEPDVLIVDEALSVGDGEFSRRSFERILSLKSAGATIVFCSHSLYQVEAFCDRVLWLDQGRQRMLGAPEAVIEQYNRFLVDLQAAQSAGSGAPGEGRTPSLAPKGGARFAAVEVMIDGVAGRQLLASPGRNTLTVRMAFESDPELPPPVAGIIVEYGASLALASASSFSDKVEIERDASGRGEAVLTFPHLSLRKGEYRVSAYLGCESALHVYDSALSVATLIVEDALPDPGIVVLDHRWHTMPGHSAGRSK